MWKTAVIFPAKCGSKSVQLRFLRRHIHIDIKTSDILLTDYMENWLADMKNILKPSTWETYDKTIHGKILPYFSERNHYLRDLKPKIFTEYFKYLKTNGRTGGGGCYGLFVEYLINKFLFLREVDFLNPKGLGGLLEVGIRHRIEVGNAVHIMV